MTVVEQWATTATEETIKQWCKDHPERMLNKAHDNYASCCVVAAVCADMTGHDKVWVTRTLIQDRTGLRPDDLAHHNLGDLVSRYDRACPDGPWSAARALKELWGSE